MKQCRTGCIHKNVCIKNLENSDWWNISRDCEDFQSVEDFIPRNEGEWRSEIREACDWKGKRREYYQPNSCSKCHKPAVLRTPFCPNCGAKMKNIGEEPCQSD